jgi:hypothetical protein
LILDSEPSHDKKLQCIYLVAVQLTTIPKDMLNFRDAVLANKMPRPMFVQVSDAAFFFPIARYVVQILLRSFEEVAFSLLSINSTYFSYISSFPG